MIIGLFSDVHANLEALEVTKKWFEEHAPPIDTYLYLGDAVGYGADPNPCTDIIKELSDHAVLGNHDAAVCGRMDYSFYHQTARDALDWHAEQLDEQNHEWLEELPYREDIEDITITHGSPIDVEEFDYVFNLPQANSLIEHWDELNRIHFIGHSHLTASFELDKDEGATQIEGPEIEFKPDKKYVVTVGSVGQPRDNDNRACLGTYDTEADVFEFHRLEYDITAAAEKIFETELADEFGKRLFFGI